MRKKERREYLDTDFFEAEEYPSDYFVQEDHEYWDDPEDFGFFDENEQRIAPSLFDDDEDEEYAPEWDARYSRKKKRRLVVCASLVGLLAVVALFLGIGSATNLVGNSGNAAAQAPQSEEQNTTQESAPTPPDSQADSSDDHEEASDQNDSDLVEPGPEGQEEEKFTPQLSNAEAQNDTSNPVPDGKSITVHVQVDSSRAASKGWPFNMVNTRVSLKSGDSVYDALCAAGVTVGGTSDYVKSINGLEEFSCGEGSGWLYSVNDKLPSYGCGSYKLKGNEIIRWIFTLDMGKDV